MFLHRMIIVITLVAFICLPALAEEPAKFEDVTFYPVDQGPYIESLKDFREKLREIVKNKDANSLLPLVKDDIRFTFGMENGKEEFIKFWELKNPQKTERNEEFWAILNKILNYGGAFSDENSFAAPYYYSSWPETFNEFEYLAVIGEHVNYYKKEGNTLKPAGTATYKIVKNVNESPVKHNNLDYTGVYLPSGQKVYINEYYLGCPVGYRAIFFKQKDNTWMMEVFIAGD